MCVRVCFREREREIEYVIKINGCYWIIKSNENRFNPEFFKQLVIKDVDVLELLM